MHIGIVGCGQLARMLALAGWPMGMTFSFLAEADEDTRCVAGLGSVVRLSDASQPAAVWEALGRPEIITVEKEAVDTVLLGALQGFCIVAPDPDAIAICQHRAREKRYINACGVATVPYCVIRHKGELLQAARELGLPLIIKSCEQGYDGQQQWRVNSTAELQAFLASDVVLGEAVVESKINFARELSVIVVRGRSGRISSYVPSENWHRRGTLLTSIAPAENSGYAQQQIDDIVQRLMCDWDYVGVLAIECFEVDGRIIVNELAPRVHNSGHWTQQGADTCQFENHLRAIAGLATGSVECHGYNAMLNLLGCELPPELASNPRAHVHLYNKQLRSGRKMGHVNLQCKSRAELKRDLTDALNLVYPKAIDRAA